MVRWNRCIGAEWYRLLRTRWLLLVIVALLIIHGAFCYIRTENKEPAEINNDYATQLQALIIRTENNLDTPESGDEHSLSAMNIRSRHSIISRSYHIAEIIKACPASCQSLAAGTTF